MPDTINAAMLRARSKSQTSEKNPDAIAPEKIRAPRTQDVGNAFVRVDEDDSAAAYLFDFLREGEAAATP